MDDAAPRGRPRGFDREEALDRAVRLFWRKGYEGASVRELSKELGIGQPSLYNAFGGKLPLFEEAVAAYDRRYGGFIEAALDEEPTAARALRRILAEAPSRYTRSDLPRGCLVASGDVGTEDERVRAAAWKVRHEKQLLIEHKIETDIESECLDADTDAHPLAAFVMTILSGISQLARDGIPTKELEDIAYIARLALPAIGDPHSGE